MIWVVPMIKQKYFTVSLLLGLNVEIDCTTRNLNGATEAIACDPNHVLDGTPCSDDGNDCRDDVCATGVCDHPPHPVGTACGDPADTECDDPDTCDGAGSCEPNYEPLGLSCGDPADTQCDNPDICDGSGLCDNNFEPDGTTCDDEDICTGDDACETGVCVGTLIAETPLVEGQGSRYLAVTPAPAGSPLRPRIPGRSRPRCSATTSTR